jgi:hypothetical protein
MGRIVLIIALLFSAVAQGQAPGFTKINQRYVWVGGGFDSVLVVPRYSGAPSGLRSQWATDGQIGIDTVNDRFYIRSGGAWQVVGAGSPNSNVGSAFRLAIPNTNNIKTLSAGYGITMDSATSNQIGITVDTATLFPAVRGTVPTIYNSDGTLSGNRVVNQGGNRLDFNDGDFRVTHSDYPSGMLRIDPANGDATLGDWNEDQLGTYIAISDYGENILYNANTKHRFVGDSILFEDASLPGASTGYVWTLSNAATGAGHWAAASGGGGATPAGNFGNLQINRNGALAAPGSDSLDFESATGFSVKGDINTTGVFNGRWKARVGSTTSSGTPTINTDNVDIYKLTAQAADITSMTTNLSGTPNDGDVLEIQITGTAARAITWGSSFVSSTITLPTTTVTTATLTVILQYYVTSSYGNNKWVCVNYY